MQQTRCKNSDNAVSRLASSFAVAAALLIATSAPDARAEQIENPIAVFAALDKVTARIKPLAIPIGKTAKFGALKVTPRICFTRPPTEPPLTTAFVEVDEIKLDGEENRIFTGWMFAQSPGLHAVEHPVFDVWLTSCKTNSGEASIDSEKKSPEPANASSRRP
jgi:hypothetical protein